MPIIWEIIPAQEALISYDNSTLAVVIAEIIWTMIAMIDNTTVIVQAHPFPFNKPYDTTKYPIPTASTMPPITIPILAKNWVKACNSAAFCTSCSCCCCCCCSWSSDCCCWFITIFSIGTVAKNVPNARNESPLNTNKIPSMIARTAIIVTPNGLSFHWVNLLIRLLYKNTLIKVLENLCAEN